MSAYVKIKFKVSEVYGDTIAAIMNVTRMEDFYNHTRQKFSISECSIGKVDCREKFELIGTLNGQCLTYNPCDQKFSRDNEFRILISGNNTGTRYCKYEN